MARDVGADRREGSDRQQSSQQHSGNRRDDGGEHPAYSTTESEADQSWEEEEESEHLYRDFLARRSQELSREELLQLRLEPHAELAEQRSTRQRSQASRQHTGSFHLSDDLATLAERFTRSEGREEVRQRAEEIDLSSLTTENFNSLLSELFSDGGVTQERVLVLFFFCTDLTIRACRAGLGWMCRSITSWSLSFIRSSVAAVVRLQGGWARVLRAEGSSVDTLLVLGSVTVVAVALYLYCRGGR